MNTDRSSVVVAGSYANALVMKCPRLPVAGETVLARDFRTTHGGKGSNMAVQVARLGMRCAFIGVVGNDTYGDAFAQLLDAEGIDRTALRTSPDAPTGVGFIMTDTSGCNLISVDMGANQQFTPSDIDAAESLLACATVIMMPLEIPPATALHAATVGKARGLITILNPAPAQALNEVDLGCVDYLTPNESELMVCAGMKDDRGASMEDAACRLLALGARHVIVTQGERGCVCFGRDADPLHVASFDVNVVDTTGAGDAFNAGLATGLAEGMPLNQAMRFANAAAALSVTRPDTVPSYHCRPDVDCLVNQRR